MKRYFFLLIALASLMGAGCVASGSSIKSTMEAEPSVKLSDSMLLLDHLPGAVKTRKEFNIPDGVRILIVPHHLVAIREIVSAFGSLPEPKPRLVYVISPDHFSIGKTELSTMDSGYSYSGGQVANDPSRSTKLLASVDRIADDSKLFEQEHGIGGLIPLIDRLIPDTRVIPIAIKSNTGPDVLNSLVSYLEQELKNPETLLIASIDMSHYLPEEIADAHDAYTIGLMRTLDAERSATTEIDSPGALYTVLSLARRLGLGDVRIHSQTNSLRLLNAQVIDEGTSHIISSFSPGKIEEKRRTRTVLFAPEGVKTLEGRLYQGQDEIRPMLKGFPAAVVAAILDENKLLSLGIVPIVSSARDRGPVIMSREERRRTLDAWEKSGIIKEFAERIKKELSY